MALAPKASATDVCAHLVNATDVELSTVMGSNGRASAITVVLLARRREPSGEPVRIEVMELSVHGAATVVPELDPLGYGKLRADIAAHGLLDPVIVLEGRILDGRARYRVCCELGIPVLHRLLPAAPDGCAARLALACNPRLMTLKTGPRALIAARLKRFCAEHRHDHAEDGRREPRDEVGALLGLSGRTVDFAARVLARGVHEVCEACEAGALPVSLARRLVALPPEDQRRLLGMGVAAIRRACESQSGDDDASKLLSMLSHCRDLENFLDDPQGGLQRLLIDAALDRRLKTHIAWQIRQLAHSFGRWQQQADRLLEQERGRTPDGARTSSR